MSGFRTIIPGYTMPAVGMVNSRVDAEPVDVFIVHAIYGPPVEMDPYASWYVSTVMDATAAGFEPRVDEPTESPAEAVAWAKCLVVVSIASGKPHVGVLCLNAGGELRIKPDCDGSLELPTWERLVDSLTYWAKKQLARGESMAEHGMVNLDASHV